MNRNIWITIIYNILVFFIKHEDTETQLDIPRQCHREAALFLLESLYTKSRNRNRQLTQTSEKRKRSNLITLNPMYISGPHTFLRKRNLIFYKSSISVISCVLLLSIISPSWPMDVSSIQPYPL